MSGKALFEGLKVALGKATPEFKYCLTAACCQLGTELTIEKPPPVVINEAIF
jgi:hypothetical protein